MECRISALSRAGGRERNEDACGYLEANGIVCCVLADGAGGHGGGDVASRLVVQSILNYFVARPDASAESVNALLHNANEVVLSQQQKDASVADMHSTIVVLVFDPRIRTAVWGHVGDSRLYLLRNGTISLRTRDHSLIQSMVDVGILTEDDASNHCERNVLVAAVGSREPFNPTLVDAPVRLLDGDAFLLSSDGFWGLVSDAEIEGSLCDASSPDDWLERLEQKVAGQMKAGSDNYSAIAVWCGHANGVMRTVPGRGLESTA